MSVDYERYRLQRKIAALTRVARTEDRTAMTTAARQTFSDSFLTGHECKLCPRVEIDPELSEPDRKRMAKELYSAHMSRVSRIAAENRTTPPRLKLARQRLAAAQERLAAAQAAAVKAEAEVIAASGDAV